MFGFMKAKIGRKLAALALAGAAFLPGAALADPELNCTLYADEAMKEIAQAKALNCGFGGDVWRQDYAFHRDWCFSPGVKIADIGREDQNRIAAIAACQQANKPMVPIGTLSLSDEICTGFANEMVGYARENQTLGCGYTDSRFDDNYPGHLAWCKSGVNAQQVEENRAFTQARIEECRAAKGAQFVCGFYEARMNDLYDRLRASCSAEDVGGIAGLVPDDYLQDCIANNGNQQWMDAQQAELNDTVLNCEGR